jgi:hypothetical protein
MRTIGIEPTREELARYIQHVSAKKKIEIFSLFFFFFSSIFFYNDFQKADSDGDGVISFDVSCQTPPKKAQSLAI